MGPFLLVLLVAAVIIAGAIYAGYLRQKFWRELAAEWGYTYHSGDFLGLRKRHSFNLFGKGHSQRVHHTLVGRENGREVVLFDYSYTTGSGKNQTTHHLSGLILGMPCSGRKLTACPENFLDRFAAFFGFEDINFELEEFNRAFKVQCEDKKFAYDVFHTGMMEYLLAHRSLSFEWCDRSLLVYSWSKGSFDRNEAREMRDVALGISQRLPGYLLAAQGN